ncbi:MAG: DAK2 domain-containing protein [Chloroflexi bacterium]|nr:DAK2 domain-containing protein [Chloroflexota bacterium]
MAREDSKGESPAELDGAVFRSMLAAAEAVLERNAEAVNALNVFPVPDGDTGTNMFLTLKAVTKGLFQVPGDSIGDMARVAAQGALMGARGNSGVILSQFFRGFSAGLEGKRRAEARDLVLALQQAASAAYKAVSQPVEGTMLTVMREAADGARAGVGEGGQSLVAVLSAAAERAHEAVVRTPALLPVLAEAGVVDAGGQGFALMLDAFLAWLEGRDPEAILLQASTPAYGSVREAFLIATEEEVYGYCTSFLAKGQDLDPDRVREQLSLLGKSVVVVGDSTMVKVHVHAPDPGPVIGYGVSLGVLSQVQVDNIDEQHQEFRQARRQAVRMAPVGVVSVAWGRGVAALMADLGAIVVNCGRTMNPSTQEMLDALARAPAEKVILLPNNPNVIPAARQAVSLCAKPCRVLPARSISQGVGALVAFNPEVSLEENLQAMASAIGRVQGGEVMTAVRDAQVDGFSVREGQLMGFLDEALVQELAALLRSQFPGVEVEVVFGGQPLCHYIISVE